MPPYLVDLSSTGVSKRWILTTSSFAEVPDQGLTMMVSMRMMMMIIMIMMLRMILKKAQLMRVEFKDTVRQSLASFLDVKKDTSLES